MLIKVPQVSPGEYTIVRAYICCLNDTMRLLASRLQFSAIRAIYRTNLQSRVNQVQYNGSYLITKVITHDFCFNDTDDVFIFGLEFGGQANKRMRTCTLIHRVFLVEYNSIWLCGTWVTYLFILISTYARPPVRNWEYVSGQARRYIMLKRFVHKDVREVIVAQRLDLKI